MGDCARTYSERGCPMRHGHYEDDWGDMCSFWWQLDLALGDDLRRLFLERDTVRQTSAPPIPLGNGESLRVGCSIV